MDPRLMAFDSNVADVASQASNPDDDEYSKKLRTMLMARTDAPQPAGPGLPPNDPALAHAPVPGTINPAPTYHPELGPANAVQPGGQGMTPIGPQNPMQGKPVAYDPNAGRVAPQALVGANKEIPMGHSAVGSGGGSSLPKALTLMDSADKKLLEAQQGKEDADASAQVDVNNAASLQAQVQSDTLDKLKTDSMIKNDIDQRKLAQDQAERDARVQQINDFANNPPTPNIDPQRYEKNMGTGSKILTTIAMIFGGSKFSQAYLANLHSSIQNDIEAQKIQYDGAKTDKQQKLLALNTAYGAARDQFGDVRVASLAAQNLLYTQAEYGIKAGMAKYQGAEAQANGQKALDEIAAKKADLSHQADLITVRDQQTRDARQAAYAAAQQKAAKERYFASQGVYTDAKGEPAFQHDKDTGGLYKIGTKKEAGSSSNGLSRTLQSQEAINEAAQQDLQNADKNDPINGWVRPDVPFLPKSEARIKRDASTSAITGKIVAGLNGSINQTEMDDLKHQLNSSNPDVVKEARARLLEGLKASHTSLERQRGQGGGGGNEFDQDQ